jgi:hypothetical protein
MRAAHLCRHLISNLEFQIVNRTDAAFADLPGVKLRRHARPTLGFEVERLWKILPAREQVRSLRRIVDLNQQRAAEFASLSEQLVVGIHFVLNLGLAGDVLGAEHFLDLIKHRVVILKKERQKRSHVDAPLVFLLQHGPPELLAK